MQQRRNGIDFANLPPVPVNRGADRVSSFWAKNDKGNQLPIIPEDVRNAIVDAHANVSVIAVRLSTSKHGPTWFADVAVNQGHYGGDLDTLEHWTLAFSPNAVRDPMLMALREACADGPMPASIQQFTAKDGNYGYDFGTPYQTDDVPF